MTRTLEVRRRYPKLYRTAAVATWISIVLILLIGLTSLESIGTLAAVSALLLAPILLSIPIWLRSVEFDSPSTEE